jgi:hypothetical protein
MTEQTKKCDSFSELEYCLNYLKAQFKVLDRKCDAALAGEAVKALEASERSVLKFSTVVAVDNLLGKKADEASVKAYRAKW